MTMTVSPSAKTASAPVSGTAPQAAQVPAWDIDPAHSSAEFAVKHLMIATVTGRFKGLAGTLHLDPEAPGRASVEATVDVASVDTAAPQRDDHLRSADFFDAANHPRMTFRSTRVELTGPDQAAIAGDLTIRGTTQPVVLNATFDGSATDPWGNARLAFTGETTLNRRDFGLTWNQALETGGVLVGDKVRVTLRIAAVRRKDA